ncbi:MAG TPA: efflux RND transporter periplasmic adaptor subunit, partial [Gammaproteobacteria bacterium]|nr:efflux RND transporter periplasmic adaptor subunit [Gammaproteobacteria bacterium]
QDIPVVLVGEVGGETFTDIIEAIGTTSANESVILTAKVTDTVSKVNFSDGDFVEAGQILVEQTNTEQSALLAEARANVDDMLAKLRRLEDMGGRNLAPISEIDQARAQANGAKGRYDAIVARLNDRLVRAPYSGLLGFREVSPGTLLTTNTPITTLDDISVVKLDFSVPELYLGELKPGLKIFARSAAWSDHLFEGQISTVNSRVNPVTRAVTVRAMIDNHEALLRPGMLLTVRIESQAREVVAISESAVIQVGEESFVYAAGPGNIAIKRTVKVGSTRNGMIEILSGLNAGDRIVIEGVGKLRDGMQFRVKGQDPVPGGRPARGGAAPNEAS